MPLLVLIAVVIGTVLWIMLTRTAWGRHVYAVGGDPEVARVSGLHADRVALSAYIVAGLLAGITGIVVIGATGVGDSSAAASLEFESLAVVVIGGTSLAGGRGRIIGVLGGVVLFGMLGNVFNLLNVEVWYQQLGARRGDPGRRRLVRAAPFRTRAGSGCNATSGHRDPNWTKLGERSLTWP